MNEPAISNDANGMLAGVLDARRLALHCMTLERSLEDQRQCNAETEQRLETLHKEQQQLRAFADAGRGELERLSHETLRCVRATAQCTGDRERVRAVEDALNDKASPETVRSLHRAATSEFRALFPTRPLSRCSDECESPSASASLAAYKLPGGRRPAAQ